MSESTDDIVTIIWWWGVRHVCVDMLDMCVDIRTVTPHYIYIYTCENEIRISNKRCFVFLGVIKSGDATF
jgi:hypothetical protein